MRASKHKAMPAAPLSLSLADPDATAAFARRMGDLLGPGDTVLLEGDVGTGKTHFARALIQSLLDVPEDVPSPTFTLVQTYETQKGEIWHADLYRLTSVLEIEELGLTDAFDSAICLVEWPDRLGRLAPKNALTLSLLAGPGPDARRLTASWEQPDWGIRLKALWA